VVQFDRATPGPRAVA